MRRELDRARGAANRGRRARACVPVVAAGAPRRRAAAGQRARPPRACAPSCSAGALHRRARRCARWPRGRAGASAVLVTGRAASEGLVRGTGQQAVECQLARAPGPRPTADAGARARRQRPGLRSRRGARRAPAASPAPPATLLPALLPELGRSRGGGGDLRVVMLDLDLNEPAVISPGAARPAQDRPAPAAAEVRRVVGRAGRGARSARRLAPPALMAGADPRAGHGGHGDPHRAEQVIALAAQVRLLPPTAAPGRRRRRRPRPAASRDARLTAR